MQPLSLSPPPPPALAAAADAALGPKPPPPSQPAICRLSRFGAAVQQLEAGWRHLVVDIDRGGVVATCGSVYIGCNPRHGDTAFGNRPHPPHNTPDAQRPQLHRTLVDDFWERLLTPEGEKLADACTPYGGGAVGH